MTSRRTCRAPDPTQPQIQRRTTAAAIAGPPGRGPRRASGSAGCSSLPALAFYAVFVLRPLVLTFQYSLYDWDGIGPSTWVGLDNYVKVFTDPDLLDSIVNAFQLIIFFSVIPVGAGPRGRHDDAADRRAAASALVARTVCSCRRSSRWSPPASRGAGCCPRPGWSTRLLAPSASAA